LYHEYSLEAHFEQDAARKLLATVWSLPPAYMKLLYQLCEKSTPRHPWGDGRLTLDF
jgi:hypothetical protein